MGKTANKPGGAAARTKRGKKKEEIVYLRGGKLSPEQIAKYADLRQWLQNRAQEWEHMTEAERKKEEGEWQRFKNSVNAARAGYRKVFID